MNALEILREACGIVGIPRPNSVVGSADKGVIQLLGLLNNEGRELSARHAWEALIREASHTTVATEDQGALSTIIGAANAYRYVLNETMWNRSRVEPILGPAASLDWQFMKAYGITGAYTTYRIRGGRLLFSPAPSADESVYFEYVTKNWVMNGEEQRRAISDDEDEVTLSDEIMLKGVEWRWRKAKGLEYAEDFNAYERMVADAASRDATKRRLALSNTRGAPERRVIAPAGGWNL